MRATSFTLTPSLKELTIRYRAHAVAGPLTFTADVKPEASPSTNLMHGPAYNSLTHARCADYSTVTLVAAAPRLAKMLISHRLSAPYSPVSARSPFTHAFLVIPHDARQLARPHCWSRPLRTSLLAIPPTTFLLVGPLPNFRCTSHLCPFRPAVVNSVIWWFVFHESWPCAAFAITLGSSDAPCRW